MAGEQLINEFMEITTASRQTAIDFIRGNGNSLEQAIGAYFENPDPKRFKQQVAWDESAFSSDREGAAAVQGPANQRMHAPPSSPQSRSGFISNWKPSLQISQFDVESAFNEYGAPSRPPSRNQAMSQQAQLPPSYGKTDDDVWDVRKPHQEFEGEDEAIRLSLREQASKEVVPDAEPSNRTRGAAEPSFLKPTASRDFLPALIAVLHSVPKCRNALLATQHQIDDYGHNAQWWSGEDIQTSTVIYHAEDETTDEEHPPAQPARPIEIEVQRLMAFLDQTERSYGSAEPLSRVETVKSQTGPDATKPITRFMKAWDSIRSHGKMFETSYKSFSESGVATSTGIRLFEIESAHLAHSENPTLQDALDELLWGTKPDGTFDLQNFVESAAPVLIVHSRLNGSKKLEVPAEMFVDRYMLSNREKMEEVNVKNRKYAETIKEADRKLNIIMQMPIEDKPGEFMDTLEAHKFTISYLKERIEKQDSRVPGVLDGTVLANMEKYAAAVAKRVGELRQEKEETQAAMKVNSRFLASEHAALGSHPTLKYTLRGAARSPTPRNLTVYAKYPEAASANQNERWWRMSYDVGYSSASVSKTVIKRDDVYQSAGMGIDDTMLVYVRSDFLDDTQPVPLPASLQRFVDADNAAFKRELEMVSQSMDVDKQEGTFVDFEIYGGHQSRRSSGSSTKVHLGEGNDSDTMMSESIPQLPDRPDVHMETQNAPTASVEGNVTGPHSEMRDRGGSMFLGTSSQTVGGDPKSDMDMDDASSSPEPEKLG